jgi:zinc protease
MDISFSARTKRFQLANGITLLALENRANTTVSLAGFLKAGAYFNPPTNNVVAQVAAEMLNKGTAKRTKLEIAESLESVGARVKFASNTFTIAISAQSLSRDFPGVVATLAEELREPAFPVEELAKLKQRLIAAVQHNQEDTRHRATEMLSRMVYAKESPFYQPTAEELIAQIESVGVSELRKFYDERYGPAGMVLVAAGDVDPVEVNDLVSGVLGDWKGATEPRIDLPMTPLPDEPLKSWIPMKDKANVDVVIGHPSQLRRANPDYLAAVIGNRALGQSTLSSRLGLKVRDEMGLTYGINSSFSESGLGDGPFLIGVTVAPSNIQLAIDTTMKIVSDYVDEGIREDELSDEQSSVAGSFKVGLATNGGMAGQLAGAELYGLGTTYLDEFPALIKGLTKADVDEAIRKYVHMERAATVIAGTF